MIKKRLFSRHSQRGSVAVEFALVAPVMILFVIGIIEVGMYMSVNTMLEGGLRQASRYGVTGAGNREAQIRSIIAGNSYGLVDMNSITITAKTYSSYASIGDEKYNDQNHNGQYDAGETYTDRNGNGNWNPDGGTPGYGTGDTIVAYRVGYNWPFLTGLMKPLMGDKWYMSSTIVVRNEPY